MDKNSLYITSDGAIKLYQTAQYKENGFFSLECIYPAKEIDATYKYYPISYPWAIFTVKNIPCVLEYPPFFYWIGSVLLYFQSVSLLLYLPLLFFGINIFIFDLVLQRMRLIPSYRIITTLLVFISFPLLTAMDYTENPAFQTLYLLGFYYGFRLTQNSLNTVQTFLTGLFFGLAFFLRLEILIPFAFFCGFYFLGTREFKKTFLLSLGFILVVSVFILYNLKVSGHPLGFRYVSSIDFNDNAKADIWKRLNFLKATLWGNQMMVGVFKFQPLLWLFLILPIYAHAKGFRSKSGFILLAAGWTSMIAIPLYITVYGGVGYFGLRYIEAPFYLIALGWSFYLSELNFFQEKRIKWIIVFILVGISYFNWVSTREGLKLLKNSSSENAVLQTFLKQTERYVIHSSFYTSIWMGNSFLERKHVHIKGNEQMEEFLNHIARNEIFILLLSPKDIYISEDIPKKLHENYLAQIELEKFPIQILEEKKLNGIRLVKARKN
ncbi:MAG TPA: hypothetical protein PK153_02590 [Leptospiraceae bacterium]|nr:hypothetical protein [Leptospiraceae bacterium]